MSWFGKYIGSQIVETQSRLEQYLNTLGVSPDVIQYILSLDKPKAQFLTNELRKNPSLSLMQLNQVNVPQKKDPYTKEEIIRANTYPQGMRTWVLVNSRLARKGMTIDSLHQNQSLLQNYKEYWQSIPLIRDWYEHQLPDISSYDYYQAMEMQEEWHKMMAGEGSGLIYEPTDPENIVYGPEWIEDEWKGWTIQKVTSRNDLLAEGNKMNHCVGSYCSKVIDGKSSIIYSLRDPQNNPHVTIETDSTGMDVKQIQGNSNGTPNEELRSMIREWVGHGKNAPTQFEAPTVEDWEFIGTLSDLISKLSEIRKGEIYDMDYYTDEDGIGIAYAEDYGLDSGHPTDKGFDKIVNDTFSGNFKPILEVIFEQVGFEYSSSPLNRIDFSEDIDCIKELIKLVDSIDNLPKNKEQNKLMRRTLREWMKDSLRPNGELIDEDPDYARVQMAFAQYVLNVMSEPKGQMRFQWPKESQSRNWYKKAQRAILLTPAEQDWAEWAIDPMFDYWCTESGEYERGDGQIYCQSQLPNINGNSLTLSPIFDINEDLLYRLEEQAADVVKTDSDSTQQERARLRGALSLAKKIRGSI